MGSSFTISWMELAVWTHKMQCLGGVLFTVGLAKRKTVLVVLSWCWNGLFRPTDLEAAQHNMWVI